MRMRDDFLGIVRDRADALGGSPAAVFLADASEAPAEESLSYGELDARARQVASWLQDGHRPGERVLLIYPPGLDFLAGFFGCLYAGAIAVPAPLPDSGRGLARLSGIVHDAGISVVLTIAEFAGAVRGWIESSELAGTVACAATDGGLPAGHWRPPKVGPDTVAFLQYTSGSTSEPKGVVVTHGALVHNEKEIRVGLGSTGDLRGVGWLPHYHDMGLIGQLLHPVYVGGLLYFMSPLSFLRRPYGWLQAISRYRATDSVAPNFAYDLVTRRITDEQVAALDLSSWKVALNGSEPIQPATLEAFARRLAPAGFSPRTLFPCYGLAESTLLVTGSRRGRGLVTATVDAAALERHELVPAGPDPAGPTRQVVSSGTAVGMEVRVVDPRTRASLPSGRVGEIWVRGGSVAAGYWGRPELSAQTFDARTAEGESGFLRTGDVGALDAAGELFVTGRIKELMIVNGRNLYPQDIEHAVRPVHPALSTAAAFTVGEPERVVLVQEVRTTLLDGLELDDLAAMIRERIRAEFQLMVGHVRLVGAGTIPRTTSGKVQRGEVRQMFCDDALEPPRPGGTPGPVRPVPATAGGGRS